MNSQLLNCTECGAEPPTWEVAMFKFLCKSCIEKRMKENKIKEIDEKTTALLTTAKSLNELQENNIVAPIKLFKDSWEWFFDTIHNAHIKREDGKSLGNFWTILQRIEEQYTNMVKSVNE